MEREIYRHDRAGRQMYLSKQNTHAYNIDIHAVH